MLHQATGTNAASVFRAGVRTSPRVTPTCLNVLCKTIHKRSVASVPSTASSTILGIASTRTASSAVALSDWGRIRGIWRSVTAASSRSSEARHIAMVTSPTTESLAKELWKENEKLAVASIYHPFVVGLASQATPVEIFVRYVGQDEVYLRTFSSSFLGIARILQEYLAAWGEPCPTNVKLENGSHPGHLSQGSTNSPSSGPAAGDGASSDQLSLSRMLEFIDNSRKRADEEVLHHQETLQWWFQQISPSTPLSSLSARPAPPVMPATLAYTSFLEASVASSLQLHGAATAAEPHASPAPLTATPPPALVTASELPPKALSQASLSSVESAWAALSSPVAASWPQGLPPSLAALPTIPPAEAAAALPPRAASLFAALRVVTAMAPCFRLYAAVGWRLQQVVLAGSEQQRASDAERQEFGAGDVKKSNYGVVASNGGVHGTEEEGAERGERRRRMEELWSRGLPDEETEAAAVQAMRGHRFAKWITTYGGPRFEDAAQKFEACLDALWHDVCHTIPPPSSSALLPPLRAHLLALYSSAMRLEFDFFDAHTAPILPEDALTPNTVTPITVPAWQGLVAAGGKTGATAASGEAAEGAEQEVEPPSGAAVLFACDFDLTCTAADTCAVFAALSVAAAKETGGPDGGTTRQAQWDALTEAYACGHAALLGEVLGSDVGSEVGSDMGSDAPLVSAAPANGPPTLSPQAAQGPPNGAPHREAATDAAMEAFFAQLAAFEEAANARLVTSRVLAGIREEELRAAGRRLHLAGGFRDGCGEVLARLLVKGVRVHVVSVAWSRAFVRAAVEAEVEGAVRKLQAEAGLPSSAASLGSLLSITANDLESSAGGTSTGGLRLTTQSGRDKLRVFRQLICENRSRTGDDAAAGQKQEPGFLLECGRDRNGAASGAAGAAGKQPVLSVVVGDSINDLPSLLEADLGVVVGNSKTMAAVMRRFDIECKPLLSAVASLQLGKAISRESRTLFKVESWYEIGAVLFGC